MTASAFSNRNSTEAGFTLVEIAIVLVIIGLLLGGILKRQEMINQARIKNVINYFNGVTVAVTSYQDRYRALPGDDPGATARWTVQAPASGDGNGAILGLYNAPPGAGAPDAAAERGRGHHRRAERRESRSRSGLHRPDHMQLEHTGQGRDCSGHADGRQQLADRPGPRAAAGQRESGLGHDPGHELRGNRGESVPRLQGFLVTPSVTAPKSPLARAFSFLPAP